MQRIWIVCGALLGAIAVMLAAVGAHGLQSRGQLAVDEVRAAAQIAGWHSLALLSVAFWVSRGGRLAVLAGCGFLLGAIVFIVAVVGDAFGIGGVAQAAPVGGTLLIAAWLLLAASAVRAR